MANCNTPKPEDALADGDLLFCVCAPATEGQQGRGATLSEAIAEATGTEAGPTFDHVGIFTIVDGDSMVIEATPRHGVTMTPLREFVDGCPGVVSRRVGQQISIPDAIERAKGYIGKEYDWEFAADNDRLYCSELVQLCYLRADGTPIFESEPMNFLDANGEMPQFWTDLFARLGKKVPQGEPGTNPNSIYRQTDIE